MSFEYEYTSQEPVLTSLREVEEWQRSADENAWTRSPGSNLDVLVDADDAANDTNNNTTTTIGNARALCHVVILDSFYSRVGGGTTGNSSSSTSSSSSSSSSSDYEQAAAVTLALAHLNTGDGSLIPQIEGLSNKCRIRFSLEVLNMAVNEPLHQVAEVTSRSLLNEERPPCAFLGAGSSTTSIPSSILTGFSGFPQLSPTAKSSQLSNRDQHPLFGRTIPSDDDNAVAYLRFFTDVLQIEHLCIVHSGIMGASSSLVNSIIHMAPTVAPNLKLFAVLSLQNEGEAAIRQVVSRIRAQGYRYVWNLVQQPQEHNSQQDQVMVHDALLEEADRQGLTGSLQWFFGDNSFDRVLHQRHFEEGSVLQKAYHGVGLLEVVAAGVLTTEGGAFVQQLQSLDNPLDVQYLESVLPSAYPLDQNSIQENLDIPAGLRSTLVQGSSNLGAAAFAYEAAVALGLGACRAIGEDGREDYYLSGVSHFDQIMKTTFAGIAGEPVSFNPATGSRNAEDVAYRVRNYIPEVVAGDGGKGVSSFRDVTTHVYRNGTWEHLTDYTFAGGNSSSTLPPIDIPPPAIEEEIVSTGVRVALLVMCGLILFQAVGFGCWTARYRKSRVVLASQPFFLYTICFGILIFGSTMIPLSLDHGALELPGCQMACTSTVWLFTLGISITLSAFVAKTHRINRILNNPNKLKRIKVTVRQVLGPMIVFLVVNIIILSVMTAVAPPEYQLEVEGGFDKFGRVVQLEGRCDWNDASPYIYALGGLNLITLMVSVKESYKARKLSMEFSETRYVFRALMATLAVTFVGLPLIFLVEDNPNGLSFVASAIIFVASTSILTLTFIPKMNYLHRLNDGKGNLGVQHNITSSNGGGKWTVSGLEDPSTASNNNTGTGVSADGGTNLSHQSSSSDGGGGGFKGTRILTLKSKSQLICENDQLRESMHELHRLIQSSDSIEGLRKSLTAASTTPSGGSSSATPAAATTTTEAALVAPSARILPSGEVLPLAVEKPPLL